jgi:hypothetical protein
MTWSGTRPTTSGYVAQRGQLEHRAQCPMEERLSDGAVIVSESRTAPGCTFRRDIEQSVLIAIDTTVQLAADASEPR